MTTISGRRCLPCNVPTQSLAISSFIPTQVTYKGLKQQYFLRLRHDSLTHHGLPHHKTAHLLLGRIPCHYVRNNVRLGLGKWDFPLPILAPFNPNRIRHNRQT